MERQREVGFIQADAATFKDLVQRLTGAAAPGGGARKLRPKAAVPFKLQERRKQSLGDLEIIKLGTRSAGTNSPAEKGPVTPFGAEPERVRTESPLSEEERDTPAKAAPPVLLTLFPLTP
ncbi:VQ motif-containing protein 31-like [Salvia divinorum]|uniref:VQ motif-containing protein 31-like n=1 Tax=Salvia divinorum TaxID=28513 RepID=A0ABD1HAL5_SALDI